MDGAFLKTQQPQVELETPCYLLKQIKSAGSAYGRDAGNNTLPCVYTAHVTPDLKVLQKAGPQQQFL